jgi:cellulose biosynthesis protein BcsQ
VIPPAPARKPDAPNTNKGQSPPRTPEISAAPAIKPARIFVSHAHEDRRFVEQHIKQFLETYGVETWVSTTEIKPGDEWMVSIRKALENSDWVLVVMSPKAIGSDWVRREVEWAFTHKPARIIPVLIESCNPAELYPDLARRDYIDFSDPKERERARRRILQWLLHHFTRESSERQDKIAGLSRECERLKEENVNVAADNQELQDLVDSILTFNGDWRREHCGAVPEFQPLTKRRAPIVAVANLKGGVGKSTICANLGATLWSDPEKPRRVLLLDLDYQGSLTRICLGNEDIQDLRDQERFIDRLFRNPPPPPETVVHCGHRIDGTQAYVVGTDDNLSHAEALCQNAWLAGRFDIDARFLLRRALHSQTIQKRYDAILLDCPPRLTIAAVNALACCDYVLIPVLLDLVSIEAVPRFLKLLKQFRPVLYSTHPNVGVVVNKTAREDLLLREAENLKLLQAKCDLAWQAPVPILNTRIRQFVEGVRGVRLAALRREMSPTFRQLGREVFAPSPKPQGSAL